MGPSLRPPFVMFCMKGPTFGVPFLAPVLGTGFRQKTDLRGPSTHIPEQTLMRLERWWKEPLGMEMNETLSFLQLVSKRFGDRVAKILYRCCASRTDMWK